MAALPQGGVKGNFRIMQVIYHHWWWAFFSGKSDAGFEIRTFHECNNNKMEKRKTPPFLKNETAFHAHRNNQNIPGSKCRNWRGPQWKNRKIKEKETWISEGWKILSEKEAFRRNAPGACAKKRTSSRTMNCRQQASRQKTGSYDAIGRMAFPAGVEPSLCRWRDGLPDR